MTTLGSSFDSNIGALVKERYRLPYLVRHLIHRLVHHLSAMSCCSAHKARGGEEEARGSATAERDEPVQEVCDQRVAHPPHALQLQGRRR